MLFIYADLLTLLELVFSDMWCLWTVPNFRNPPYFVKYKPFRRPGYNCLCEIICEVPTTIFGIVQAERAIRVTVRDI